MLRDVRLFELIHASFSDGSRQPLDFRISLLGTLLSDTVDIISIVIYWSICNSFQMTHIDEHGFVPMWEAYRLASLTLIILSLCWPWEFPSPGLSCRSVWAFVRAWLLCVRADWHTVLCVLWMSKSCKQAGHGRTTCSILRWTCHHGSDYLWRIVCHQRSFVAPSKEPSNFAKSRTWAHMYVYMYIYLYI